MNNQIIITRKEIKKNMLQRIAIQSRLDGNNLWLPLRFLKYKWKKDNDRSWTYEENIYNLLYIAGKDASQSIKHYKVCDIDSINIQSDNSVSFEIKNVTYIAMTPTGERNLKTELKAKSFSNIVIDHVTPISVTLNDYKNCVPELTKVSDFVKQFKKQRSKKEIESEAKKNCGNLSLDYNKLEKELDSIVKNSHYRLVSRKTNSLKGVSFPYKHIYECGSSYLAFIDNAKYNGKDFTIYQDLSNPDLLLEESTVFKNRNLIEKKRLADIHIDFL